MRAKVFQGLPRSRITKRTARINERRARPPPDPKTDSARRRRDYSTGGPRESPNPGDRVGQRGRTLRGAVQCLGEPNARGGALQRDQLSFRFDEHGPRLIRCGGPFVRGGRHNAPLPAQDSVACGSSEK